MHKAPLEEVILASGQFPLKSLQAILKFTHLHRLELRDVASKIDFTFLQDVGALLNLESFILDARSCKYTARIPDLPSKTPPAEHTEAGSQMPPPSSDIDGDGPSHQQGVCSSAIYEAIYNQISFNQLEGSSISAVGGFYQLKKFHFVGDLPLLQDMILYTASSTVEDISITVYQQDPEQDPENMRVKRRQKLDQETQLEIVAMEKAKRIEYGSGSKRVTSSRRQAILEKAETRWKEEEAQYEERKKAEAQYEQRKKAERVQKLQKHRTILQTVSSRWSADLKTVKFNNLGGSSQPLPILPILPKLVYEPLFCLPKLEILEFKQWKIDSVEEFLLSMKSSRPKNLKQLHLPIDNPGSAISLSGLLDIAEACPMLKSLHCCIDTLPPIPEYYSTPTTKALSHGLQSLFVANNPTSPWDFNQLLLVARHLYLTFPRLQTIDGVEGPNVDQWVRIRDLIKMFQVIRQDDVNRFY